MKANLMFQDRDFDLKADPCFGKDTLTADLGLERILSDMAQEDEIISAACGSALFCPLRSIKEIRYRQENLRDAFRNPDTVWQLYEITVEEDLYRDAYGVAAGRGQKAARLPFGGFSEPAHHAPAGVG